MSLREDESLARDKGDKVGSSPCASEQKAEKRRPCATSATNRGPAPFPLLLYKASSTVRTRQAWHFYSPIPILFTTGRRRGQARCGGAPPQLHRATATLAPHHELLHLHRSPSAHRQGRQLLTNCYSSPEAVLPQPPQLLLLFRICPCLVPCFPCFQILWIIHL